MCFDSTTETERTDFGNRLNVQGPRGGLMLGCFNLFLALQLEELCFFFVDFCLCYYLSLRSVAYNSEFLLSGPKQVLVRLFLVFFLSSYIEVIVYSSFSLKFNKYMRD